MITERRQKIEQVSAAMIAPLLLGAASPGAAHNARAFLSVGATVVESCTVSSRAGSNVIVSCSDRVSWTVASATGAVSTPPATSANDAGGDPKPGAAYLTITY